MLNALLALPEFLLASRLPVIPIGSEPASLRRNSIHARELKLMRERDRRARREANAADRAERSWLRRLGLAKD